MEEICSCLSHDKAKQLTEEQKRYLAKAQNCLSKAAGLATTADEFIRIADSYVSLIYAS